MLIKVKEQLQARSTGTTIAIRRQAIVCEFSDDDLEVVSGYAAPSGYWIGNPAIGWMLTHPKGAQPVRHRREHESLRCGEEARSAGEGLEVPPERARVVVLSRDAHGQAHGRETSYSPLWDLYLTLKKMREAKLAAMNDPTGLGSRFGFCSSESNRLDANSKFDTAVSRALKTKDYANDGYESLTIEQLKLLFNK